MSQLSAAVASIDPKYAQEICAMAKTALAGQVSLGKIVDVLSPLRKKVETFSGLSEDQKVSALLDGVLSALTPAQKELYESHLKNLVPSLLKSAVDLAPTLQQAEAVGKACLPFLGDMLKGFFPCLVAKVPVLEKDAELAVRFEPDSIPNLISLDCLDPPVISDQDNTSPKA